MGTLKLCLVYGIRGKTRDHYGVYGIEHVQTVGGALIEPGAIPPIDIWPSLL